MKKIIFLLLLILVTGCQTLKDNSQNEKYTDILANIQGTAIIDSYTIYGRFFNLSGVLEGEKTNLTLVLKSEDNELSYNLITKISDGKTLFNTTELINEGINLEDFTNGEYIFFIKEENAETFNYYALKNNTSYQNLEYYTITKNNTNSKINISFSKYQDYDFLYLESIDINMPNDFYDIVIDPGHGGVDVGANKNGYYESNINLDYAIKLASELTKLGLKVRLTRESDVSIPNYGEDGRVSIPYQTKAKLMLSIHMNSAQKNVGAGGIEVYVPSNANIDFAKSLAQNVVDLTSTQFSNNVSNKIYSGVYLRTLSTSDIQDMQEEALEDGYSPYELATTNSTYYYIIRETGGIITHAYVDSRNSSKPWNPYYNSNHGCETYLLELGYMNSSTNLKILLEEKDEYIDAIVKSVKEYLEI